MQKRALLLFVHWVFLREMLPGPGTRPGANNTDMSNQKACLQGPSFTACCSQCWYVVTCFILAKALGGERGWGSTLTEPHLADEETETQTSLSKLLIRSRGALLAHFLQ